MQLQEGTMLSTGDQVKKVYMGGFSEVAIVENEIAGPRALKRLRDAIVKNGGRDVEKQFARECQIWLTKLEGAPHVAKAFFHFPNLEPYGSILFMEYVEGLSLLELRRQFQRLSISQVVRAWHQMAQALAFAHSRDVRHRDLKPNNILIDRHNQVKIIDWGLASITEIGGYDALASDYCSPERLISPRLNDPKDDIYATGIVLYECLTGHLPGRMPESAALKRELEMASPLLPESMVETLVAMLDAQNPARRPCAAQQAALLDNPMLFKDIEKREIELPFCPECHFVSQQATELCPLCGTAMRRRVARPVREGMIRIPAGSYICGLTAKQATDGINAARLPASPENVNMLTSLPLRRVFMTAFDIDEFPVTNAEFAEFCHACNYPEPDSLAANKAALPDHPVVNVDWKDAFSYALWVSKRLPFSREWEKAARGDKDTRSYPWGDTWDPNRCNHNQQRRAARTTTVAEFTNGDYDGRSPYEVADMVGNVGEWLADGKNFGLRYIRGGGWNAPGAVHGLITFGAEAQVDHHDLATGLRCAADIIYDEAAIMEE